MDNAKLAQLYGQAVIDPSTRLSRLYAQALLTDETLTPVVLSDLYAQCICSTGFTPTAVDTSDSLSVDNLDVDGVLCSDRITEDELAGGVYDFARVTIYLVNWQNISDPKLILRRGTLVVSVTVRPVSQQRYGA